ncbi:MAG: MmgE/PrpD family protein [Candidatus Thermoplasmatota archaeon]|nr:MmgE/PrpD family protein [Candidatus Thermoplasmatota archaeon]
MNLDEQIYEYSTGIDALLKDSSTREELKKRIVDSLFVSYGARDSEAVRLSKRGLLPSSGKMNAPIYFDKRTASVDIATYLNGCMTRYLDYNDTYLSKEALHPSDNIPPILSYAYSLGESGLQVLRALATSYQVVGAFADAFSIRDRGWDHVTYISISSAAGLGVLNGFDKSKFINTLNLAINNNISLRQTRAGELSMWKGCTAANATRNSVFASLLANEGFTGPSPIFEGEMGFFKQVTGNVSIDLKNNRILRTMIKNFPVEYHAMSAVESALWIKDRLNGEMINSVKVDTFSVAQKIIVKDPEKLRPKTKETADHSLPYIIAYTLLYGEPDLTSFDSRFLNDPLILKLIDKMTFNVTEEYDALYPEYLPVKISVSTKAGSLDKEVKVPKGHFKNPFDWKDLENKGFKVMKNKEKVREIIEIGQKFENSSSRDLFDLVHS